MSARNISRDPFSFCTLSYYLGQIHHVSGHLGTGSLSHEPLLCCMGPNSNPFHQGRKGKLLKKMTAHKRGKKKTWYLTLTFKYRLGSNLFMQLFRENDHEWALIISIRSDVITVYAKSILCSLTSSNSDFQ